jgi:hypothetical protein
MNLTVTPHVRKTERIPPHVKRHRARLALIKQVDTIVKYIKARSLATANNIDDGD